jgi:catechol 2,3-dioxygenase-like lactoylglutathione lyase family enzyme
MNTTQVRTDDITVGNDTGRIDLKLEAVVIPVTDVDRAKAFYNSLDWRLDADFAFDNGFRIVQFTPPGSPASVQFGSHVTAATPGSAHGLYLVVTDIQAARDQLAARGVHVSEVFHPGAPGAQFEDDPELRVDGRSDSTPSYGSFATFADPDGNTWLLQEVTTRLPGRIDSGQTSYASVEDLTQALIRVATAHGEHEKRNGGEYDEQWPVWYAAYMVAEQNGEVLPL